MNERLRRGRPPLFDEGAAVEAPLVVWEREEPADAVQRWTNANGFSPQHRDALIDALCDGLFRSHSHSLSLSLSLSLSRSLTLSLPLSRALDMPVV